jgi:hypothetical protein
MTRLTETAGRRKRGSTAGRAGGCHGRSRQGRCGSPDEFRRRASSVQREHDAERRNDEKVIRQPNRLSSALPSRGEKPGAAPGNHGQRQSRASARRRTGRAMARDRPRRRKPKRLDDAAEDQEGQGVGEGTRTLPAARLQGPQHQHLRPKRSEAVRPSCPNAKAAKKLLNVRPSSWEETPRLAPIRETQEG